MGHQRPAHETIRITQGFTSRKTRLMTEDRRRRRQTTWIVVGTLAALLLLVSITYTVCFMSVE